MVKLDLNSILSCSLFYETLLYDTLYSFPKTRTDIIQNHV